MVRCRASRLAAHHYRYSALSEWPHDIVRLVASQWPASLCSSETKPFLETPLVVIQATLKRIVPVTKRRSSCLQDNTGQIVPQFLIISLLYHICLSRSQERLLHRVARKGEAQPRSEPSGGCADKFACCLLGRRLPKRENGRRMSVLLCPSHACSNILVINSPMFHACFCLH